MKKISFETLQDIKSRKGGLTPEEVLFQRNRFGSNHIFDVLGSSAAELIIETLKDPMIWFLLGVGSVFTLIGDTQEAFILLLAIVPLIFMDFFLHWRTRASVSALTSQWTSQVRVLRGSQEILLDARELVPGDLVVVSAGVFLPADGIFESAVECQVDESVLTGEAFPILKRPFNEDPFVLADQGEKAIPPEVFGSAGTRVLTGQGHLRILATGLQTTYGEIVQSVAHDSQERTPLQKSISHLVQRLIYGAVLFCLLLAGVRILQGHGWVDAVLSAATLAIAAIPEEFPVVFTFFLGVGIYRLARRRALVRRAVSVENIGRVTQICTDKTGTITAGVLKLTHLEVAPNFTDRDLLVVALAASGSETGDPVDEAIHEKAREKNLVSLTAFHRFPFTEDRKLETALVKDVQEVVAVYAKGSPEVLFEKSQLSSQELEEWKQRVSAWAKSGHKVLACAQKKIPQELFQIGEDPEQDLRLVGLLAFEDPPRPEVGPALEYCRKNGIRVLMITGDHPETSAAIAKDAGLGGSHPRVISAEEEPEKFQEEWLQQNPAFLKSWDVVARCTPLQKYHIVKALKSVGELVAVTGDGVNDAPALRAADIGIAMGERGSRSAKEVSSIIIADDNFSTIVNAIMEGRQLFINLKMSFEYLLLIHIPFVLTAALIPLLGYPLLYLPVHIVWLELIIHPTALLAFQGGTGSQTEKSPLHGAFFSRGELGRVMFTGLTVTVALALSFISGIQEGGEVGHARAKSLALLVLWSAGLVLSLIRSQTRVSVAVAILTLVFSFVVIQVPELSGLLHLSPLHGRDWLEVVGLVIVAFAMDFIFKRIKSRKNHYPPPVS